MIRGHWHLLSKNFTLKLPRHASETRFYWTELQEWRIADRVVSIVALEAVCDRLPSRRIFVFIASVLRLLVKVGRNNDLTYGRCHCLPQLGNEVWCYQWVRGLRSYSEDHACVCVSCMFTVGIVTWGAGWATREPDLIPGRYRDRSVLHSVKTCSGPPPSECWGYGSGWVKITTHLVQLPCTSSCSTWMSFPTVGNSNSGLAKLWGGSDIGTT
jgi:hypothetical protein